MRELTQQSYQARIVKVINYIQANLDNELSLEELARLANFSNFHFHRIFSGMLGESVKELVRRLKLERAATELHNSSATVLQIALAAGYESDMSFIRAFKAKAGLSPSTFRKQPSVRFPCSPRSSIRYLSNEHISSFEPFIDKELNMKVLIKTIEDLPVAAVRHIGPYNECGPAWDKLCEALAPEGLLGGDAKMIGVSYDDPDITAPENIRYDACVSVPANIDAIEGVNLQVLAGGEYAVTTHIGAYENLADTYRQFFGQWLSQSQYESADKPCIEIYLNDPESTEVEELITDIYLPLKDA